MKITGMRTYKFTHVGEGQTITGDQGQLLPATPAKDWLFFKIETDAGISGWGEGSGEWLTSPVEAMLRDWEPLLAGRDPLGDRGDHRRPAEPQSLERRGRPRHRRRRGRHRPPRPRRKSLGGPRPHSSRRGPPGAHTRVQRRRLQHS